VHLLLPSILSFLFSGSQNSAHYSKINCTDFGIADKRTTKSEFRHVLTDEISCTSADNHSNYNIYHIKFYQFF
jgi:hypothetical protein